MDEILRQVGWTDGFNIPALSDENRRLEAEVAAMMREKASLMTSVAELDDLLGSLNSHTQELETEYSQNETMLASQQKRLDLEDALIRVLQGEQSRLKNAIAMDRQERKAVEERCQKIEKQLRTPAPRSGDLGAVQEHWQKQEALASLTTNTLEDFYKQDEVKLKELELQRLRLQEQVTAATNRLHKSNSAVVALEQQLETSANLYKVALATKAELAERWKSTAKSVREKDEINRGLKQEISELGIILDCKQNDMRESRELEENEQRKNRELEAHTRLIEHDLVKLRDTLQGNQSTSFVLNEEVNSLQRHLAGCGSDLSELRKRSQELTKQIKEMEEQRDLMKESCMQRKARLADLSGMTEDSEKRNLRLEEMVQEKLRAVSKGNQDIHRIETETTRTKQELGGVKQSIDNCLVAVNAEQAALRNSQQQKNAVDKLLERHRDMILDIDLGIQRAELRLQRIANEKAIDAENATRLAEKELLLKEALSEKKNNFIELERDLRNTESSERQVSQSLFTLKEQCGALQEAEKAYWAEVEGGDSKISASRTEVENSQVKVSLMKAKVTRRSEELLKVKAEVLSLKNTALQADRVGRLQSAELASELSALTAEVNGAEHENSELRVAIKKRKLRIEQLQGVLDMTLKSMEGTGAENLDSIQCITKQQIRVAQEKGELVQKGNMLDLHIRTAEKEIQAMEHTLALVKSANDRYRSSLALPGATSAESVDPDLMEKIQQEEQRQNNLRAELKDKKESEAKIFAKCQNLREELTETEGKYQELLTASAERRLEVGELERDLADQDVKLRRAVAQAKRLKRELRAGHSEPTFEERDIQVKEMKRVNTSAMKQLWELGHEAKPLVVQYLQEKGLPYENHGAGKSKVKQSSPSSTGAPGQSE
ncbi:coiled-coil domain-containing protein 39-like [Neocloeon triangulifer]|uniref:coiled-coil domain-containing protein 39-like n=1 Tax=Neocloeon triangulifer TaxID=2078957 RepID=UPI00286F1FAC|nr:coiled-coil domain-containing protein 39-like [Neocloeon triangulifer]